MQMDQAKMADGPDKQAMGKFVAGAPQAMGIQDMVHPLVVDAFNKNSDLALQILPKIADGTIPPPLLADPGQLMKEQPDAVKNASAEDISGFTKAYGPEIQKNYQAYVAMKNKNTEDQLNRQNAVTVANARAGASQVFGAKEVEAVSDKHLAQLAPEIKQTAAIQQMQAPRDRVAQSLAADPTGHSVSPQDMAALVYPLLHQAVGRVTVQEISGALGIKGIEGKTQSYIAEHITGGENAQAASNILQWVDDAAQGVDAAKKVKIDSMKAEVNGMSTRSPDQKKQLLNSLGPLEKPVYTPRPSTTISFMGHQWTQQQLQQTIDANPNSPNTAAARKALQGGQ